MKCRISRRSPAGRLQVKSLFNAAMTCGSYGAKILDLMDQWRQLEGSCSNRWWPECAMSLMMFLAGERRPSLTLVTADSISWPSSKHVRWVCAAGRKLTAESFVSWTAAGVFRYIFHYDFRNAHAQLGCCVGGRQTLLSWVHLQIKSRKTVSISCTILIHEACKEIMRWSIYLFICFCHSCKISNYFLLPCVGESYKWSYYRCLLSCFVLFRLWSIHSVLACDQRHVET